MALGVIGIIGGIRISRQTFASQWLKTLVYGLIFLEICLGEGQKKLSVITTNNLFNLKSNTMKNTMQS